MMNDSRGNQTQYDIEIEWHLDDGGQEWLEGFALVRLANGRSTLTSPIQDQAATVGKRQLRAHLFTTDIITSFTRCGDDRSPQSFVFLNKSSKQIVNNL